MRRVFIVATIVTVVVVGGIMAAALHRSAAFPSHGNSISSSGGAFPPVNGVTGQTTITGSCTGNLCTPATSCATFNNGQLTGFAASAC